MEVLSIISNMVNTTSLKECWKVGTVVFVVAKNFKLDQRVPASITSVHSCFNRVICSSRSSFQSLLLLQIAINHSFVFLNLFAGERLLFESKKKKKKKEKKSEEDKKEDTKQKLKQAAKGSDDEKPVEVRTQSHKLDILQCLK
jgi:hypothetical protein